MMTYEEVENVHLKYPESSYEELAATCKHIAREFVAGNEIMRLIDDGEFTIEHFHSLLLTIFHQVTVAGSTTLALAGVMTDSRFFNIREYLLHHAEEEQNHWKWIVQNLRDTGYTGPDPREMFPAFPTQAYLSFSMSFSLKHPIESLAISYVLESLSSQLATDYGEKAAMQLKLSKEQMSFFLSHGELDKGHEADILEVLKEAPLSPYQWALCEYAAKATLHFYKGMYNYAADQVTQSTLGSRTRLSTASVG